MLWRSVAIATFSTAHATKTLKCCLTNFRRFSSSAESTFILTRFLVYFIDYRINIVYFLIVLITVWV